MNNLRNLAKTIYHNSNLEINPFDIELLVDVMIKFGEKVCELQKIFCLESSKVETRTYNEKHNVTEIDIQKSFEMDDIAGDLSTITVNKESILNSENVCKN